MTTLTTTLRRAAAVAALIGLPMLASGASAQERLALLVGNAAYPGTPARPSGWMKLDNPTNDVTLVESALSSIGFEVTVVKDGDRASMQQAIDAFAARTKDADLVVFYFAGHGFEHERRNYLVPVDAPSKAASGELAKRFIDFERAANAMTQAKTTIFLLDACRTGASFVTVTPQEAPAIPDASTAAAAETATSAAGDATRSATFSGSAKAAMLRSGVNDYDYPPGAQVAVLYSTGRGIPARDSVPPPLEYSPFAWEVAKRIIVPQVEISEVFNAIRQGVYDRTRAFQPPQAPYTYNSLSPGIFMAQKDSRSALVELDPGPEAPRGLVIAPDELELTREPVLIVRVLSEYPAEQVIAFADKGDPPANYVLAYMLENGLGIARDLDKARARWERAAAAGLPAGQLGLANFLHYFSKEPEDRARAVSLYRAAAEQGYTKGQAEYARILVSSRLVARSPENRETALAQLRLAAAKDFAYAMYWLTVVAEPEEAAQWTARLETLAAADSVDAHHWLCQVRIDAQDRAAAVPHCSKAATAGFAESQAYMARAANEGWIGPRNPREALHWMRQALARPHELDPSLHAQMISMRVELSALTN